MKLYNKLLVFLFFATILSNGYAQSGIFKTKRAIKLVNCSTYDNINKRFISIKEKNKNNISDTLFFTNIDLYGNEISRISFANFPNSKPDFIQKSVDGGYYLVSTSTIDLSRPIFKFDSLGNIIWKKVIPFFANYPEIIPDNLGNTYLVDFSASPANNFKSQNSYGGYDIWVIKLDKTGNKIWDKVYGGDDIEELHLSVLVNDNKLVILCSSKSGTSGNKQIDKVYSNNNYEIWGFAIDSLGNKILDKVVKAISWGTLNSRQISKTPDNQIVFQVNSHNDNVQRHETELIKLDSNLNIIWSKFNQNIYGPNMKFANGTNGYLFLLDTFKGHNYKRIDSNGNLIWNQFIFDPISVFQSSFYFDNKSILFHSNDYLPSYNDIQFHDSFNWIWLEPSRSSISGKVFPDFNADCKFNKSNEYNVPKLIVRNKAENTYAITNDSNYTIHIFEKDTAVLEVVNLDGSLYTSCGKNSITLNMSSNNDTTGIDFPIRSYKSGHCINITSFSSGLLRPGRWGDYQLNFQNNAFDTAYNAYIEIELDMSTIDSIVSPYAFSQIGNILKFNLGHIRPFGFGTISYSIKLKTSVVIGSSQCHRVKVFPHCSLYPSNGYDGSDIKASVKCLGNNTIELELENAGGQNQTQRGKLAIYQDESLLKQDSFKMDKGTSSKFQYQFDDNKVFTAEVYSSNAHPVTPILIRHQDLCANKRPIISNNPVVNFYRHDEAKEYEESCRIVQGSYDPNVKSVQPSGFLSEHYTANGTELKYRIDFQNTGTDTAFRVVLVDTLSALLNVASFVPGVSSHPYSLEFGGRAVKFIFDPIALVDSFKNEPLSHGYVHFKIKPIAGISPKTKIENNADIYFDYNAPIRTNTVFNTIFDTIQIYVPKGGSAIVENDKTSVILFPNPTTDKFFIQMSEPVVDLSIEIYDMQGRMIKTVSSTNNQTIEVSAQGMTKGIYHIRCMSGEKLIVVKKVMVE